MLGSLIAAMWNRRERFVPMGTVPKFANWGQSPNGARDPDSGDSPQIMPGTPILEAVPKVSRQGEAHRPDGAVARAQRHDREPVSDGCPIDAASSPPSKSFDTHVVHHEAVREKKPQHQRPVGERRLATATHGTSSPSRHPSCRSVAPPRSVPAVLERPIANHLMWLRTDPAWDPILDDPRSSVSG